MSTHVSESGRRPGHGRAIFAVRERVETFVAARHAARVEHGLAFLVDGRMTLGAPASFDVEPGAMILVPAGVPHRDVVGTEVEYWLAGFCATCLRLDESQPLMQPFARVRRGGFPLVTIARGRRRRVARLFGDLRDELERSEPEAPELARSLLLLLLGEVLRAAPRVPAGFEAAGPGSPVADALAHIQRHALEPISLRDVAAAVHRSPAHVATAVKRATGRTVGDWITAVRIAEAGVWLLHSDESVEAIAGRVGWQDTTHFIRQFRKLHGRTPAAWRRAMRALEPG